MTESIEDYYDPMARDYHLLFADWKRTVRQDGETLDRLIRGCLGTAPRTVLDCACGIGTQSIGLALHGYQVHATDISPPSVARAAAEARSWGVSFTTQVADIRSLESEVNGEFDVVLACDNALPHCLDDRELGAAVRNLTSKMRRGGLLLASQRDYDALVGSRPEFVDPHVYRDDEGMRLVFQVWDWSVSAPTYRVHQFIMRRAGDGWETAEFEGEYRTLLRRDLDSALAAAGLRDIRWLMPAESGYYQPVVMARKGEGG